MILAHKSVFLHISFFPWFLQNHFLSENEFVLNMIEFTILIFSQLFRNKISLQSPVGLLLPYTTWMPLTVNFAFSWKRGKWVDKLGAVNHSFSPHKIFHSSNINVWHANNNIMQGQYQTANVLNLIVFLSSTNEISIGKTVDLGSYSNFDPCFRAIKFLLTTITIHPTSTAKANFWKGSSNGRG